MNIRVRKNQVEKKLKIHLVVIVIAIVIRKVKMNQYLRLRNNINMINAIHQDQN